MKQTLIAAVLAVSGLSGGALADERASPEVDVTATVERFLEAMTNRDLDLARRVVEPDGRFFAVRHQDGGTTVRSFTNQEWLDGLADREAEIVERVFDPLVLVHRGVATVWARYELRRDGAVSHCGVDSFTLIEAADGWRITGGAYTVEPNGCDGDD